MRIEVEKGIIYQGLPTSQSALHNILQCCTEAFLVAPSGLPP